MIASCFALVSFAAAIVVGMTAGNPAQTIIWRATLIMIACWFLGYGVGTLALKVVNWRIEEYQQTHPVPTMESISQSEEETESPSGGAPSAAATAANT